MIYFFYICISGCKRKEIDKLKCFMNVEWINKWLTSEASETPILLKIISFDSKLDIESRNTKNYNFSPTVYSHTNLSLASDKNYKTKPILDHIKSISDLKTNLRSRKIFFAALTKICMILYDQGVYKCVHSL